MRRSIPNHLALIAAAAAFLMTTSSPCAASVFALHGVVQQGTAVNNKPLDNIPVTLEEATGTQPVVLGRATTDARGRFTIQSPLNNSSSIFFLVADVNEQVEFVTVLGAQLPSQATVNELTTVAASYSLAQFYKTGIIAGPPAALRIASGMNDNLVASKTGDASPVMLSSPNGDQTISLRETRALANLLAACVDEPAIATSLLELTTDSSGNAPQNTAVALAYLARHPEQSVASIYQLTQLRQLYAPALAKAPDAWTIAVKVNDSGDDRDLFGGPARLVFDSKGYAWVTNNVVQGTINSSRTLMVLQPNGQPSNGTGGTPVSPIKGGGILGGAFGITIDPHGSVWESNFGWGLSTPKNDPTPNGNGSVSQFTASGIALSPPFAYQGGPVRAQGMASDAEGNIWICSYGTDEIYVFLQGDPKRAVVFKEDTGSAPFDIAIAADGTAWVSNSGGFTGSGPSSVAKYKLANGTLQRVFLDSVGSSLKGLAIDSQGNCWIASLLTNNIYGVRPDGSVIGTFTAGGVDGPWDVTVDGDDNLWVTNFGPLNLLSDFSNGRLSKLCGVSAKNCGSASALGAAISPSSGYTMPSGGSPVLLHNEQPLYGPGFPPSFAPMMRQTSSAIDQAGNVWSINNWKPNFLIDEFLNPGGDGILIFVGAATPPVRPAF